MRTVLAPLCQRQHQRQKDADNDRQSAFSTDKRLAGFGVTGKRTIIGAERFWGLQE